MAVLSAVEIYRYARLAGFSPDQAVTMTAVALAESGGNTNAHNPHGENSQGLWQINAAAHPNFAGENLYDPLTNARAAFEVSGHGDDVSAWTTTHGIGTAKYLSYQGEAEAAAHAAGDNATGVWTGTAGYGHPLAAGDGAGGGVGSAMHTDMSTAALPGGGGSHKVDAFVQDALAQAGDPYVWGATPDVHNANPTGFDCSSLVEWAAGQVGIDLPRTSYGQYLALQQQGDTISVEQALHTRGALLFDFSTPPTPGGGRPSTAHVAISLGDGRTIEAMDTQHGVLVAHASTGRFNYAAVVPGMDAMDASAVPTAGTGAPEPATALAASGAPPDWLERLIVSDLWKTDSDGDGISDGYEIFVLHTDPTRVDTNNDGVSDALSLIRGIDPTAHGALPGQLPTGPSIDQLLGAGTDPLGGMGSDPLAGTGMDTLPTATSSAAAALPVETGLESTASHLPLDHVPGS
jgi:cell wall-associated NlpC family hydrolase